MDKKPWLNRNFKKGTVFQMSLPYIIDHLEPSDKEYVLRDVPQDIGEVDSYTAVMRGDNKNWWINYFLSRGKKLEEIDGLVKLILIPINEEFTVQDGRTRLRFYRCKGYDEISVELYKGAF